MPPGRAPRWLVFALVVASLCGRPGALAKPDAAPCELEGKNHLRDADFALEAEDGRSKHWSGLQHAGEQSFSTAIETGVLTITRTGTQPWFLFRQTLPGKALAGRTLVFSAELKMDLRPMEVVYLGRTGGGLFVTAKNASGRVILRSELEHDPHMGVHDWQPVEVRVDLPAATRTLELGFTLRAQGTLQVRDPALREVSGSCRG